MVLNIHACPTGRQMWCTVCIHRISMFSVSLAVAVCVWSQTENEGVGMNVHDKLQHSRVYRTWCIAQGQTTFTPTLPLISQCYSNHSCRVKYQHSLINPDSQQKEVWQTVVLSFLLYCSAQLHFKEAQFMVNAGSRRFKRLLFEHYNVIRKKYGAMPHKRKKIQHREKHSGPTRQI